MNDKPTLTVMVGFPRSGKNTWIDYQVHKKLVVEPDWIRTNILGHQFHKPAEPIIWMIADSFIRIALSQGHDVILNGVNLLPFVREKYISLAKSMNADVDCVWIKTPMGVCVKRNNVSPEGKKLPHEVLIAKEEGFVAPTTAEGFRRVLHITTEDE